MLETNKLLIKNNVICSLCALSCYLEIRELFLSAVDLADSNRIFFTRVLKAFLPEIFRGLLDILGGKVFCKSTNSSP